MMAIAPRGKVGRVSAFAILAAFLFASWLCATPQLHAKIHGAPANHECAVTLIASGKCELSDTPPLVAAPRPAAHFSTIPALNPVWVAPPFFGAAVFEHAPPGLS
jgi:hypothetical protein